MNCEIGQNMGCARNHVGVEPCRGQEGFPLFNRVEGLHVRGILGKMLLVTSNHVRLIVSGEHGRSGRSAQ